ncbi:MAG: T9SS type A sorting domain-containing protein, partial [Flavobacteriia bacterium]|nr:T9SS type A sorting domain-containing protein [Flavobacteriia bacterium]
TNEVISLASLKDGIYIANVTANGQTTSFKLIKR